MALWGRIHHALGTHGVENYEERIKVVEEVAQKREQLSQTNYSSVTKRNKLIGFIKEKRFRQE